MRSLDPSQRDFCRLVARASVANHFGDLRLSLDRSIGGAGGRMDRHELFHRVAARARQFVDTLDAEGAAHLESYQGEERQWLELTFLFDIFHRFMEAFDAHIVQQLASPRAALKVPFAEDALRILRHHGFGLETALAHVGFFYQLRRAFFFIDQQLTGTSPCMTRLKQELWNTLFTHDLVYYRLHLLERMEDFSVMLLGETGTGKGTAAGAIGRAGYIPFRPEVGTFASSFASSFLSINLSQFPPGLIESELFGHEKGAFTGAVQRHEGILSRCSVHGAIFLDEIGEVSAPIQIKLLDVLQQRTFSPVGSHTQHRFSGRILAATNLDLEAQRRKGVFRDDFYYRLCSDVIVVPSLRERVQEAAGELLELIRHRLRAIVGHEDPDRAEEIHRAILEQLGPDYPWPGNVRELEQCIRRMLVRKEYRGVSSVPTVQGKETMVKRCLEGELSVSELSSWYCRHLYERLGNLEKVAKVTGLDWRTVRKYVKRSRDA